MPRKAPNSPIVSTTALARHLGLSRWTISRVLNGHSEVKAETSRRVREAMNELGFVPSPLGRALRGARTGMVGVSFQAIGLPIISRKIATLQRVLREAGFRALQEVTDGNPELELTVIRHFLAMRVDGLVLVGGVNPVNTDRIKVLLGQHRTPVVLIDPLEQLAFPTVELDRRTGIRIAFEHLFQLGHRRFALLGIDERVSWGRVRCEALHALLAERAMPWDRHVVTISDPNPADLNYSYGRDLAQRFLELPERPTAILALNDQVAIGANCRLREAGLRIPGDVSVVGFDNIEVGAHVVPALTTVDQHVSEIMQAAVALLVQQTGTGAAIVPTLRQITPVLVPRLSTGQAPAPE